MSDSSQLFAAAQKHIPGGVNSPVRAFKGVGGDTVFIESAAGPYLFGADGRKYIDYVGSWGPMILGHAHHEVIEAVQQAVQRGLSFGAPTELETLMADKVCELMPSIELVRMVSSGTEATMSAIRLARGFTGRDKIVKFEGCYHGHSDSLLVKAGSGALTFGEPSSPGVPASLAEHTITLNYNDSEQVRETFSEIGDQIACIIVEPVAGNMNCIPPAPGFLETLREVCDESGAVLIFDEVMTGFRVGLGGVQALYGVTPDLTTLGKIIGGGMPVGAFGGFNTSPDWQANAWLTYSQSRFSTTLEMKYIGSGTLNVLRFDSPVGSASNTTANSINDNTVDSRLYFTWAGSYDFEAGGNDTQLQLFWSINNLLDQDPPVAPGGNAFPTNPVFFDTISRRSTGMPDMTLSSAAYKTLPVRLAASATPAPSMNVGRLMTGSCAVSRAERPLPRLRRAP